jgi:hypothetical protein
MSSQRTDALEAVAKVARTVLERIKIDLKLKEFNCGCDYCQLASALRRLSKAQK